MATVSEKANLQQLSLRDTFLIQDIRDDAYLNAIYPDMQTCSEEELKRRSTDLIKRMFGMPLTCMEEEND